MWICMNNGFVSVAEDQADKTMVYVRARDKSHLENFMDDSYPKFQIVETPDRDYTYRIHVTKSYAAFRVAELMLRIDYTNFKDSVHDVPLKQGYHMVWRDMFYALDERANAIEMYTSNASHRMPK